MKLITDRDSGSKTLHRFAGLQERFSKNQTAARVLARFLSRIFFYETHRENCVAGRAGAFGLSGVAAGNAAKCRARKTAARGKSRRKTFSRRRFAGTPNRRPGWLATDALGRKVPVAPQVPKLRREKWVGIFYSPWLGESGSAGPIDNTKILAAHLGAMQNWDDPAWKGGEGTALYKPFE